MKFLCAKLEDASGSLVAHVQILPYETDPEVLFYGGRVFRLANPGVSDEDLPVEDVPGFSPPRKVIGYREALAAVPMALMTPEGSVEPTPQAAPLLKSTALGARGEGNRPALGLESEHGPKDSARRLLGVWTEVLFGGPGLSSGADVAALWGDGAAVSVDYQAQLERVKELERYLWGAVHNAGRNGRKVPRRAAVVKALGVGSTTADRLCRSHDLDPDEEVGSNVIHGEELPETLEALLDVFDELDEEALSNAYGINRGDLAPLDAALFEWIDAGSPRPDGLVSELLEGWREWAAGLTSTDGDLVSDGQLRGIIEHRLGWPLKNLLRIQRAHELALDEEVEDPEHTLSERYPEGQLALAAASYAIPEEHRTMTPVSPYDDEETPEVFPWDAEHWKPSPDDRRREIVKAASLLLLELDRLDEEDTLRARRAAEPAPSDGRIQTVVEHRRKTGCSLKEAVEATGVKTNRLPAWDEGFEWGPTLKAFWPLTLDRVDRLRAVGELKALVRVASVRPEGSSWLAFRTGPRAVVDHLEGLFDDGEPLELRFGWAPPAAVDNLPEFEGF